MRKNLTATLAVLAALAMTSAAKAEWKAEFGSNVCNLHTVVENAGRMTVMFNPGHRMMVQLWQMNASFGDEREPVTAWFNFDDEKGVSGQGYSFNNYDLRYATASFPISFGYVNTFVTSLADAKTFTVNVGGKPWTVAVPGAEVIDKFADCIKRNGGVHRTSYDR